MGGGGNAALMFEKSHALDSGQFSFFKNIQIILYYLRMEVKASILKCSSSSKLA